MKISEAEREEVKRMYFEQGMTRKDIAGTKRIIATLYECHY